MKNSRFVLTAFLGTLLASVAFGCAPAADKFAASSNGVYMEGTYFGEKTVTFTIAQTKNEFVKTYDNGIQIVGEKKKGDCVYYIIDTNKRLITKVSQSNLYRIGMFLDWNAMTGLINLMPGTKLMKERESDSGSACEWYRVENKKTRICMNTEFNLPVAIEENGITVERTFRLEGSDSITSAESVVAKYLRQSYRFVDADEDISPDVD